MLICECANEKINNQNGQTHSFIKLSYFQINILACFQISKLTHY
jgi:hypothetical protein